MAHFVKQIMCHKKIFFINQRIKFEPGGKRRLAVKIIDMDNDCVRKGGG